MRVILFDQRFEKYDKLKQGWLHTNRPYNLLLYQVIDMEEKVLPIKDSNILDDVKDTLLNNFKAGRRNYTIFQLGKATLLRVSDVLSLKKANIYSEEGIVNTSTLIHDIKTGKANKIYLKPVQSDLIIYRDWLMQNNIKSKWLFPSMKDFSKHITPNQYYKIMHKVGDLLNIDYLGTHTMRKTGAYRVYVQSNYDIALVMKLLNHSSEAMTLSYLGIDQSSKQERLDKIDFG